MRVLKSIACMMFFAVSCLAQVTARSEATPEDTSKMFRSPMVLSLPVPAVNGLLVKNSKTKSFALDLRELRDYECDGVVLVTATAVAKERWSQAGDVALELTVYMRTKPGVDKLVDVKAELLVDDKPVATGWDRRIDAEEHKKARATVLAPFRLSKLKEDATPTLRLTFFVTDNP